ncbi:hypothetical protein LTR53_003264 [Teratosphaeriaceae sp. CCFEE 6253]|nr:hypothetical protein LTR53_003264 [Teratosphaeriaceae sp. CCFEE 6253]
MADVFYFRSPCKTSPISRRAPIAHRKANTTKRRRPGSMKPFNPHACMARFDEPTFCDSTLSAMLARCPLPLHDLARPFSQPVPDLSKDGEDNDNDAGGVPLTPQQAGLHLPLITPLSLPASTRSLPTSSQELPAFRGFSAGPRSLHSRPGDGSGLYRRATPVPQRNFSSSSSTGGRSVLGSRHPRPATQGLWDEEDSRRLRFALDGFDTSEVPRFLDRDGMGFVGEHTGSEEFVSPPSTQPEMAADGGWSHTSGQSRQSSSETPLPTAPPAPTPGGGQQESRISRGQSPSTTQRSRNLDITMLTDDDGLPVDDHRQGYDFAEFMDDWRLRSILDKGVTPFEAGAQPSIRMWRPPPHLSRDEVDHGSIDIQAIEWDLIGPRRRDALAARTQLCDMVGTMPSASKPSQSCSREAESYYRFRGFTSKHQAKWSHYQLRNVLVATSRSDIFYSSGNEVRRTSLACPAQQDNVMDLPKTTDACAGFQVTCLATSPSHSGTADVLLAGGLHGEYALSALDQQSRTRLHKGFVTLAYNGVVTHIHAFTKRRCGAPMAAFCSNDRNLRLFDIGRLSFVSEFTYPHAINCAVTSPDGRLRALVGDCRDAYITDAEKGDTLVKLQGHMDHGFACAWSADGTHVVTGAQDNRALVWDARNWLQPLHVLPSMSCTRSLHFGDDGALVVAESHDLVSVYDAGTFRKRQDLRFFGSIAGVALLDGGEELVIGNCDKTVGGLLSFRRAAQGRNLGTFGEQMPPPRRTGRRAIALDSGEMSDLCI